MGILFDRSFILNHRTNISAVTEAKKDKTTLDVTDIDDSTDYTSEADEEIGDDDNSSSDDTPDENEDVEATDYTEDNNTDDDTESEDNENSDESDDQSSDDIEPTDYTSEVDDTESDDATSSDDGMSDSSTESVDSNEPTDDDKKNAVLIKDMTAVYYSIKSTNTKLDNHGSIDILTNRILVQVKKNLTELQSTIYDYILNGFKSNTYAKNLYVYSSFIEAYKINIEMLRKIEVL